MLELTGLVDACLLDLDRLWPFLRRSRPQEWWGNDLVGVSDAAVSQGATTEVLVYSV